MKGDIGRAFVRAFLARAVAMFGLWSLSITVARFYGAYGLGVYAVAQSLLLGAGILARCGMDNALMRYVGQDRGSPRVLKYFLWASRRSIIISCVAALFLWFSRDWLELSFRSDGLSSVMAGVALAVPAYTIGFLLSGFFKGVRMPATACLLENGIIALVAAVLLVLFNLFGAFGDVAAIGVSYALSSFLVSVLGSFQIYRWFSRQSWWKKGRGFDEGLGGEGVSSSTFFSTSHAFFVTNIASFIQSVLSVLIAGWLLSSFDLGLFKSAQQTALLIGFSLIVINSIFPPRFASLYYEGRLADLESMARQGAALGAVVSAPALFVCLVYPQWILSWFGPEFVAAANLLRVIACAQIFNVATGSVGFLLNMTGNEVLMRNISLVTSFFGLLAFFVLIPLFGAFGAAVALAFVLTAQNLTAMLFVRLRLKIWTLPGLKRNAVRH
ncbi:oligosaccharide flippase family protein [Alloalcanivorax sp. C16-2]|uniref:oligosaccharide flippase family protein n=1 Tax=Alloalcanivorax sp. C16-2 TaxID=3390052 RepID=UPI003970D3B3